MRGTRSIAQRVALAGVAESLFAGLPARDRLIAGSQVGETAGYRWRVDVTPANVVAEPEQPPKWVPLAVSIRLQAINGAALRLTTVRLVKRTAP